MLNPSERRALESIERELETSDPDLAGELSTLTPVRRRRRARRSLLGAAALAVLAGIAAVMAAQLAWGLLALTVAVVLSCGYLAVVLRDRIERARHGDQQRPGS